MQLYSAIQFNGAISLKSLKSINGKNNDPFDWGHWNYCTLFILYGKTLRNYLKVLPSLVKLVPEGSQALSEGGDSAIQGRLAPLHDAGLPNLLHLVDNVNDDAIHLAEGVLAHLAQVLRPAQLLDL